MKKTTKIQINTLRHILKIQGSTMHADTALKIKVIIAYLSGHKPREIAANYDIATKVIKKVIAKYQSGNIATQITQPGKAKNHKQLLDEVYHIIQEDKLPMIHSPLALTHYTLLLLSACLHLVHGVCKSPVRLMKRRKQAHAA